MLNIRNMFENVSNCSDCIFTYRFLISVHTDKFLYIQRDILIISYHIFLVSACDIFYTIFLYREEKNFKTEEFKK